MSILRVRRGRPHKFSRPARTVTLTLPDDVIERLTAVDSDLGRAVVRLSLAQDPPKASSHVEVASFGSRAVILVAPSRELSALPGVELVPIADGRRLIALDEQVSEEAFELLVGEALEDRDLSDEGRELFTALLRVLRDARHETRVTARRILVLRARPQARRAAPARPRRH
jgi:hypothetical protein